MKKAVLPARPPDSCNTLKTKKPWGTSGVPHGLDFTSSRHTGSRQTPPMKLRHHQLFFERISLNIILSPTERTYSKLSAACQPGLFAPFAALSGKGFTQASLNARMQRQRVRGYEGGKVGEAESVKTAIGSSNVLTLSPSYLLWSACAPGHQPALNSRVSATQPFPSRRHQPLPA